MHGRTAANLCAKRKVAITGAGSINRFAASPAEDSAPAFGSSARLLARNASISAAALGRATLFRSLARHDCSTSASQAAGLTLRTELRSPAAPVPTEGSEVPIADVTPNHSLQPTSHSSLRSSRAAAELNRYTSRRNSR
jgi:hypothetical protein